jgi:hypothetical protein
MPQNEERFAKRQVELEYTRKKEATVLEPQRQQGMSHVESERKKVDKCIILIAKRSDEQRHFQARRWTQIAPWFAENLTNVVCTPSNDR